MISITMSVNVALDVRIWVKSKLLLYLSIKLCSNAPSLMLGYKHTDAFAFFVAISHLHETKWASNLVVRCAVQFDAHH